MFWTVQFVVLLICCGIIHTLTKVWIRVLTSPLSNIPSPSILVPLSRLLWALPLEYRGRLTLELPILHAKYGPLLRIGPNELSFYSLDMYKVVYSTRRPFPKDPRVYGQFVQDDHPALFSMTDAREHTERRRLMGQLFNVSKISALEDMMAEQVNTFVQALDQKISSPIMVVQACRALDADVISTFGFGEEIGAIASWRQGEVLDLIAKNDERSKTIALFANLPILQSAWFCLESLIYTFTGWQSQSTSVFQKLDNWSASRYKRLRSTSNPPPERYPNLFSTMIRSHVPPPSAMSEAKEMLGPGTDSTGVTCAHILWALAHAVEFQDDLARDLAIAGWPTGISVLEGIPRLNAAIKEGIRWAGAASAMLPRVVPDGGVTLAGKFIPGGTIVSTSPVWYLRDKVAFPSPELYLPSRWLEDDDLPASSKNLRDQYYIPFSQGSNNCIASHFAYLELCLAISQILKTFRMTLPGTNTAKRSKDAKLPERLEWVTAVLVVDLKICFDLRQNFDGKA